MIRPNRKKAAAGIALALFFAGCVIICLVKSACFKSESFEETIGLKRSEVLSSDPVDGSDGSFAPYGYAYVTGAVLHAGVYEITENTRVFELIEEAGGALPEADLSRLNQADRVYDGMHLVVPFSGSSVTDEAPEPVSPERLNINAAGLSELMSLNGIGQAKAEAILEYRRKNGYFRTVEDLLQVPGIGDAILNGIRDRIKV